MECLTNKFLDIYDVKKAQKHNEHGPGPHSNSIDLKSFICTRDLSIIMPSEHRLKTYDFHRFCILGIFHFPKLAPLKNLVMH